MPRLHRCHESLYRGPQPHRSQWREIAEMGIRSVVNLRIEDNSESEDVEAEGMVARHIPVVDWSIPTVEQVGEFLRFVRNPENGPVLVHCLGGVGRTGIMVTCWRISQGIDASVALDLNEDEIAFSGLSLTNEQRKFVMDWAEMQRTTR